MLNARPAEPELRSARVSDAAQLAVLFDQLGYPDAGEGLSARLERQLLEPGTTVFVSALGGTVTGALVLHIFAPLHLARPWAVISSLVIDEQYRSHGTGALLLAAADTAARAAGCAHLELSCSERRTRAHAFYIAHGFAEVRKRMVKLLPA